MGRSASDDAFQAYLQERNFSFYIRGKNFGVEVLHDNGKLVKYRFSTLGVHDEYEAFMQGILNASEAKGDEKKRDGENKKKEFAGEEAVNFEEKQEFDQNDSLKNEPKTSNFQKEVEEIYRKKQQKRQEKQQKSHKQKPRSR